MSPFNVALSREEAIAFHRTGIAHHLYQLQALGVLSPSTIAGASYVVDQGLQRFFYAPANVPAQVGRNTTAKKTANNTVAYPGKGLPLNPLASNFKVETSSIVPTKGSDQASVKSEPTPPAEEFARRAAMLNIRVAGFQAHVVIAQAPNREEAGIGASDDEDLIDLHGSY